MPESKRAPENIRFAALATDVALLTVMDGTLKVLLTRIDLPPYYANMWALPGGLIREDETAADAAQRITRDKAGVDPKHVYLEQLYTFSRVDRDPRNRVVSVAYLGLVPGERAAAHAAMKRENTQWCDVRSLPSLAYDHAEMTETAVERLRGKIEYTNIAFGLLPDLFTLTELQDLYETIRNEKLDKRNFRRKVIAIGLIEPVKGATTEAAHRPAQLYRFASTKPKIIEVL